MELRAFAHRDSMVCNWDRRLALFADGKAAMTYGWSIRAARFELDESSPAHGRVEYVAHPAGPGARRVSPIGGFSLAIPQRLDAGRVRRAWKVMEYLTRPEMMKWYVQNGNLTSPRFSTSADPEVQAKCRIIPRIDAMERRGELQIWPRPPAPEFHEILVVLGEHIFMMLQGELSVAEALATSQSEVDAIMRRNGRY